MSELRLRSVVLALFVPAILVLLPMAACGSGGGAAAETGAEAAAGAEEEAVLVGRVTREELEIARPEWMHAMVEADIDVEASNALAAVPPGAEVVVLLGTWCSDSGREVPRLWRALDQTGGMVPFEIEYVAVDRSKEEPADLVQGQDLRYVPTFVVRRGGEEVGRVVESAPNGIERDLLALLSGEASGVLTGRDDMAAEGPADGGE